MNSKYSMLRMDLNRCFRSPLFMLSAIAITILKVIGVLQEIQIVGETSILYLTRAQQLGMVSLFFGVIPYSTVYCMDYLNRFDIYSISRASVSSYTWSKIICAALSACLVTVIGNMLFYGALALKFPIIESDGMFDSLSQSLPFGPLLISSYPVLYLLCLALMDSFLSTVLASLAVTVSSFIPNIFVALSSPIIFFYTIVNIPVEGPLSMYRVLVLMNVNIGSPVLSLLYAAIYTIILISILGVVFNYGVKRRLRHG